KKWYLKSNPDVRKAKLDPVEHYLSTGWKEGRNPSESFDDRRYLKSNPDVKKGKVCPLLHYLQNGIKEGRSKFPEEIHFPAKAMKVKKFIAANVKAPNYKRIAIFASFSSDSKISRSVLYYLDELNKVCDAIFFVADSPLLASELKKLEKRVCYIQCERHGEYDFGSYKRGFTAAEEKKLLDNVEEIVFCNDSVYGPCQSLSNLFQKKNNIPFWGITKNNFGYSIENGDIQWREEPHLQTYFFAVKRQIFMSEFFQDFMRSVKKCSDKHDIIINYEMGLTRVLRKYGYGFECCYENKIFEADPTIKEWNDLIQSGLFLKKKLVRRLDPVEVNSLFSEAGYPFELIKGKIIRKKVSDYELIKKSSLFNAEWYLKINQDVKRAGADPVAHYLYHGWKEGRNPSIRFNGNEYLEKNDKALKYGICPLLYHEKYGKSGAKSESVLTEKAVYKVAKWLHRLRKGRNLKKILLISHELSYTGAPMSLLKAAECLIKQGYQVGVVSLKDGPLKKEFKDRGINVRLVSDPEVLILYSVLYDVAIVNTLIPYLFVGALHDVMPTIWWIREGKELLDKLPAAKEVLRKADYVYTMSDLSRNEFLPFNSEIKVIKHGITDYYKNVPLSTTPLKIAVIGSVEPRKGQDIFIDAIRKLDAKLRKKTKFYIIGKFWGNSFEKLSKECEKLDINILPVIEKRDEMMRFYEKMSLIVVPSRVEPTSRAALEAMMMGRPVIMSDRVGAQYLLKDGVNGYLFENENSDQLAGILTQIIKTPKRLKAMENEARTSYLEHNSIEAYMHSLDESIKEVWKDFESSPKVYPLINVKKIIAAKPEPQKQHLSVSVVIPVYNAPEDVAKTLKSIAAAKLRKDTEIILIDDASEEETKHILRKFAEENSQCRFLENEKNLGFIKTCNRGFDEGKGEIVVLLNSDTMIPQGFDERIENCFVSDKKIAFASPVFTHSGLFNFPATTAEEFYNLDRAIKNVSCGQYPMITPEGFCFCCRKSVIEEIGKLDTKFGMGYCEEDDLVMRALASGYKTVLIDNLCVYHKSHASFSSERRKEILKNNLQIFRYRWGMQQAMVRNAFNMGEVIDRVKKRINHYLQTGKAEIEKEERNPKQKSWFSHEGQLTLRCGCFAVKIGTDNDGKAAVCSQNDFSVGKAATEELRKDYERKFRIVKNEMIMAMKESDYRFYKFLPRESYAEALCD
ncbi:glycosyltransferase, partial [bacterium]|nr:glycosyltransferase [bacterium]